MKPVVWLASYPKSGNTWFRLLLANLDAEQPVDINRLRRRDGIASARAGFDQTMLFPAGLLTHEECDALRPLVYRARDEERDGAEAAIRFVKTHDAWTRTPAGLPLLGGQEAARGAILIVRDPRDVAPSLASHSGQSIEGAIAFLGDPQASFCGRTDRQHNQLRQQLPGWSCWHEGWLAQRDLPLHLVRYEDIHADAEGVLAEALAFAGLPAPRAAIARAVRFASFVELSRQERVHGFREAPPGRSGDFFRRGVAGGWPDELTPAQARRVEAEHGAMMARFGYHPQARAAAAG